MQDLSLFPPIENSMLRCTRAVRRHGTTPNAHHQLASQELEQMNARVAKEEIALMMPTSLSQYADEPRLSDAEASNGVFAAVMNAVRWLADLPRRRAVLAELNELSEHELADIGLNREFAAQRARSRSMMGRVQIG
jgi:uncharacterized protein YjiS (DUF1127 family)